MSNVDKPNLVGWLWASSAVAVIAWLGSVALVVSDVCGGVTDAVPAIALHIAGCATVAAVQLGITYGTQRARDAAARERLATTVKLAPIGQVYSARAVAVVDQQRPWTSVDRDEAIGHLREASAAELAREAFSLGRRVERRRRDGDD